jgi:hypothetical protein
LVEITNKHTAGKSTVCVAIGSVDRSWISSASGDVGLLVR